jgi:hypothetical protein
MRRVKDGIVAVVGLCPGRGRGTEFVQANCEDSVKESQYILVGMQLGRTDELNAKKKSYMPSLHNEQSQLASSTCAAYIDDAEQLCQTSK